MPSTKVYEDWRRPTLTFEIEESSDGWEVTLIPTGGAEQVLAIAFATEEAATKVGQAILDYSYGPAEIRTIDPKPEKEESKPKTRKAPGKRIPTKSAGGN